MSSQPPLHSVGIHKFWTHKDLEGTISYLQSLFYKRDWGNNPSLSHQEGGSSFKLIWTNVQQFFSEVNRSQHAQGQLTSVLHEASAYATQHGYTVARGAEFASEQLK